MKRFHILSLTTLVAISSVVALAQKPEPFSEAEAIAADGNTYADKWKFMAGDHQYEFDANRRGKRVLADGVTAAITLPAEKNDLLERTIYFRTIGDDLIVLYEVNSGGAGTGFIIRLDGKTLKPEWRLQLPGFNIARALSEQNFAYVGAIGFAAKIDLNKGVYLWKDDDLYTRYKDEGAFNIFELPQIEGDEVVYTEKSIYGKESNVIRFNKNTGKDHQSNRTLVLCLPRN